MEVSKKKINYLFSNSDLRKLIGPLIEEQLLLIVVGLVDSIMVASVGESDPLTCLLALDSYVKLYKGGVISMREFVNMPYDNDILEKVIIKKDNRKISYMSHRNISTDFPVLTCAVSKLGDKFAVAVGARPQKAVLVLDEENILSCDPTKDEIEKFADYVEGKLTFGSNMRASKDFRSHLCKVLVKRCINEVGGM